MKNVYKFTCLSEDAKKKAAEGVCEMELKKDRDYAHETITIAQCVKSVVKEELLEVDDIYWDAPYGQPILDLSSVKMTEEFFEKLITKKEFKLFNEIQDLTGGYLEHKLFDVNYNREGYELDIDHNGMEEKEAIKFLIKYSIDDEIRDKYKFHLLLKAEFSCEEKEELIRETEELIAQLCKPISEKINTHAKKLYKELVNIIKRHEEYNDSENYWYDCLEHKLYPYDIYLFNSHGDVIVENENVA